MKNVMRAVDADLDNLDKLEYPVAVLCKKDGVRTLVRYAAYDGPIGAFARTNKLHRNPHIQYLFARPEYLGFDGEGIVGPDNAPLVSYESSGGFSRKTNKPKEGKFIKVDAKLHVFDIVDLTDPTATYEERHAIATQKVNAILAAKPDAPVQMIPYEIAYNEADVLRIEAKFLEDGYEGFIVRSLKGLYKNGTATQKEGTYLRGKRFEEREMIVSRIEEGQINNNPATTNERGQTERSSHKENMVPNGMVGTIYGYDVIDGVIDYSMEKTVSPGKMTEDMAKFYFENPGEIVNCYITYKFFPVGNKTKPRFPTYQRHRAKEDM